MLSTPLWQQAFRWFRKTHNIHPEIKKNHDGYSFLYYKGSELNDDYWINYILEMTDEEKRKSRIYKTYEEAQIACLRELIEFVKSRKPNNNNEN